MKKINTGHMSDYVEGLHVKEGRLINSRPDGISGIQQAANIRRAVKKSEKINTIVEAIEIADMKKSIGDYI